MIDRIGACVLALGLGPSAAIAAEWQPEVLPKEPLHARMVSERTALVPGQTSLIGFTFEMDPGWHVYSNSANDSGMPLSIKPLLPEGFTAGPIRWPVPMRHLSPGDILDYVYEGRVTLVMPITVPSSATPGQTVSLHADLTWFVCRDVCRKGEGKVDLVVPIAAAPGAEPPPLSPDAPLFGGPFPEPALPDWIKPSWSGRSLSLPTQGDQAAGITRMVFCPATDSVDLDDPVHQGEAAGSTLRFDIRGQGPDAGGGVAAVPKQPRRVKGILEVFRTGVLPAQSFTVDIPVPDGAGS